MTDRLGRAKALKEKGEYADVADIYFEVAMEELVESEYDPIMTGGKPLGWLLRALSAATICDDDARQTTIYNIVATLAEQAFEDKRSDEPAAAGVAKEWLGDASVLRLSSEANQHYEAAQEHFSNASNDFDSVWSMEIGSDYAQFALLDFFEAVGIGFDVDSFSTTDYERRLQYKRRLVDERDLLE